MAGRLAAAAIAGNVFQNVPIEHSEAISVAGFDWPVPYLFGQDGSRSQFVDVLNRTAR